jgi:hypothetical protein
MVAPSEHVEFNRSPTFLKKISPVTGLELRIVEHLRCWPKAGVEIVGPVRELRFEDNGHEYGIVFARRAQRLNLMNLFELPHQQRELAEYLEAVRRMYGGAK